MLIQSFSALVLLYDGGIIRTKMIRNDVIKAEDKTY